MGEAVFKINGVDFLPYTIEKSIKVKSNDIDSEDAGMMLNGVLRRDRIITRYRIDVTIMSKLKSPDIHKILSIIAPVWVSVEYNNPFLGGVVTHTCYSNNIDAPGYIEYNGVLVWDGFSFPLIEQGVPQ